MHEYAMTMSFLPRHPPIPGYEPIRVLGQNGAIVYVARSVRLDKPVALQVWNRPIPGNAAALVGLEHPNIVGVFDVGEVDGHSYFAFEYVEAESLAQRLRKGPLTDVEARNIATAIAWACYSHVRWAPSSQTSRLGAFC
jgi:eukaryotic-like serine/threonine-protein kinase